LQVVQVQESKRDLRQRKAARTGPVAEDDFNPVHCNECGTIVAMYDVDEVYHFYNVIASEP
jgi:hypothetical protein